MSGAVKATGWGGAMKMEITSWFTSSQKPVGRELFELVKNIGESKSKQEEDAIIGREVKILKSTIGTSEAQKKMKEFLIRLIYCEMLGHEVSFGYIHAINTTQQAGIIDKRVGYLAASLFLHEKHELLLLMIQSIKKDLESDNALEICAALTTICKLMSADYIPAVLPKIVDLVGHPKDMVRKKAVMALHRCWSRDPDLIQELGEKFRRALCDKDPSVMAGALAIFYDLIQRDPSGHKDLIPSFASILKQVIEHKLPKDYEYHRVPAPWIQIKLLQILAVLGRDDQKGSEGMYEMIHETMKRADTGINAGSAIIYECVRTITTIYPNSHLLDSAAHAISRFIKSDAHNLKYLGLNALSLIVQLNPKYAAEHQLTVIECLEDSDETIRRKTLDLLYKMTNSSNVKIIAEKMIQFLRTTTDTFLRKELVSRLTQLAENFSPDNEWFVEIMTNVFFLGGDLVRGEVAHNLIRLIAEGSGENEDADNELRAYAVDKFLQTLEQPHIPDVLVHIISWVLGEYSYLLEVSTEDVLNKLCDLVEVHYENPATRGWIITAITKVLVRHGSYPAQVKEVVDRYKRSVSSDVQQRCYELEELMALDKNAWDIALPEDASCEDVQIDSSLAFLDDYVKAALNAGCAPYKAPTERRDLLQRLALTPAEKEQNRQKLNFAAYEKPAVPASLSSQTQSILTPPAAPAPSAAPPEPPTLLTPSNTTGLVVGGKRAWGPQGWTPEPTFGRGGIPDGPTPVGSYEPVNLGGGTSPSSTSKLGGAKSSPAKQNEKLQLAGALFGNLGGETAAAAPRKAAAKGVARAATRTRPGAAAAAPAPAVAAAAPVHVAVAAPATAAPVATASAANTGGRVASRPRPGAGATTAAPAAAPAAGAAAPPAARGKPAASESLLLDLGFDGPTAAPPPRAAAKPAPTGVDLLMMDFPGPAAPATAAAAKAAAGKPAAVPAGAGFPGAFDLIAPVHSGPMLDFTNLVIPQAFALQVANLPRATPAHVQQAADAHLRIMATKLYKPDELLAAVFIAHASNDVLKNVNIVFTPPPNLKMQVLNDPEKSTKPGPDSPVVVLETLQPRSYAMVLLKLRFEAHNVNMSPTGAIQYQIGTGTTLQSLRFVVDVQIPDLLRKHLITTPVFGEHWKALKCEKKITVAPTSITTPAEFMTRVEKQLNISPIQIIGQEAIAAGRVAVPNAEKLLLLHGKLDAANKKLELSVHTQDMFFTDIVMRHLAVVFK